MDRAYRVRELARRLVYGDPYNHFAELHSWASLMELKDADTRVIVDSSAEEEYDTHVERYTRSMVVIGAVKRAMTANKGCFAVDASFVTSGFRGVVFACVTTDARGKLWPLAVGHASAENADNWSWFLQNAAAAAPDLGNAGNVVLSDLSDAIRCVVCCCCCVRVCVCVCVCGAPTVNFA